MGALLIKDLRLLLSDRKTLAILILMPLINAIILGFSLGAVFDQELPFEPLSIAVVKAYDDEPFDLGSYLGESYFSEIIGDEAIREMTEVSNTFNMETLFFDDFLDSKEIQKFMHYEIMTSTEANHLMSSNAIDGVIVLPDNFVRDSQLNFMTIFNNPVIVETIVHPDSSLKAMVLNEVVGGFTSELKTIHSVKNMMMASAIANDDMSGLENLDKLFENNESERSYHSRNLPGKKIIDAKSYYSAAMLSMFLLFSAGYGSKLLLRERKDFTFQRQKIAGVSFLTIVISKSLTVFTLVIIQSTLLILLTTVIFGIQWGDVLSLISIVIVTAFCVAGMGQLLGAIALKQNDFKLANVLESGLFQLFAFIGGSFLPLLALPDIFQLLSYVVVNGVALRAYMKVLEGGKIQDIILLLGLLIVYGVFFIVMSTMILRKEGGDTYA